MSVSLLLCFHARAQDPAPEACPRPASGSAVPEPADLRSQNGALRVELTYRSSISPDGQTRYCYFDKDGAQAPTLRVHPGDRIILSLKNELAPDAHVAHDHASAEDCASGPMSASSTNLHFHGLLLPPLCHEDDVLHTLIQPASAPFEYSFQVPPQQPPGLYWYHPHVHGFAKAQALGGASGALIVEGLEKADPLIAGLPERVLIVRDQELVNPNAAPVQSGSVPPPIVLRDAEGDILNNGTGMGKPAKDLSLNFVPVPYPEYPPAVIEMKPGERQLWRVLNASAITYLDLQVLFNDAPQRVGLVALDGVPLDYEAADRKVLWKSQVQVPPGGRAEFIVTAPPENTRASFVTRSVDTGPAGENDPTRPLATIIARHDAAGTNSTLPSSSGVPTATADSLRNVTPVRQRKLYFSEVPQDPKDPNSPTTFFLTVDGQTPKAFDPHSPLPNMTVDQGDVEDWTIENRSSELHAFHIHQTHFMLLEWNGVPVDEPYLRDTVNVAYWDGKSTVYPSVKLRMDFRGPNIVGTFLYHCHLLEHEDNGMMGTIQVRPARKQQAQFPHN